MDVEVGLISKIIETGDFSIPTDMQITAKYFSGRNRKAFIFIQKHVLQYGNVPSEKVFKSKMRNYQIESSTDEGMRFFCDEVRNKLKHNTIVDTVEIISDHIEHLETGEAYELIKQLVIKVENEVILSDKEEVNANTAKRLASYHERANNKGMIGIPSGIDRLDHVLKGYNGGELTALLGFTGSGKTWWSLIQAVYQAKQGYKVLLFTTEMSTRMIIRRIDAIWCKLSYTRFTNGNLTAEELTKYENYLDNIEGDTDSYLVIEQATGGVSQVGAKIDQHSPDIVYVDGAYLLNDDESGEDDWMAVVRVFRGLHKLALNKDIPIVASTQSKDKKVELSTIAFAKALAMDCDIVMALEQDEEMYADREIKTKFLKIREGSIPGNIVSNWDFDKMDYSTIYIEGYDGNPIPDGIKPENNGNEIKQRGVQVLK